MRLEYFISRTDGFDNYKLAKWAKTWLLKKKELKNYLRMDQNTFNHLLIAYYSNNQSAV